jgi:tetratricopeptide (TPR) repeat protein
MNTVAKAIAAGIEYQNAGRLEQAEHIYRQIHAAVPQHADPPHLLGAIARERGDLDEAARCIAQAIALNPQCAVFHNNLGAVYDEMNRHDEAESSYRRAVDLAPQMADAHYNLGNVLQDQNRLDEAAEAYRRSLVIDPQSAQTHYNLANALRHSMQLDEAEESYSRAITIDPSHVDAHWNRSLVYIQTGRLELGWREYDWRLQRKNYEPRGFSPRVWDGSDLHGQRILLVDEQGIGDTVLFTSCVADVIHRAAECVIECKPRMMSLLARSFPKATLLPKPIAPDDPALRGIDWQIPLGSLPQHLRQREESFPRHQGYLRPDPAAVATWRERLAALGEGLKVGISWRGGVDAASRRAKTTSLDAWRDVLALPNVRLINLQYGDCATELDNARHSTGAAVHDFPEADFYGDLDNVAALVSALDLVISVPNTNVHVAGALGVPVWIALPHAPQWRWLQNRSDSPWYPSVRIFRRTAEQPWEDLFATIAMKLVGHDGRHGPMLPERSLIK